MTKVASFFFDGSLAVSSPSLLAVSLSCLFDRRDLKLWLIFILSRHGELILR